MRIFLGVNSDLGRRNTIGFRFEKIVQELANKKIAYSVFCRKNYSIFETNSPFYGNFLSRFFNALRIYLFPKFNFREFEVWLFDYFCLRFLKKSGKFDLAHFGECLPKSMEFLKQQGTRIFLDIPIGHYAYYDFLRKSGFILDEDSFEAPKFLNQGIVLADLLIIPSEFVGETLKMAGFEEKKSIIVPFGADWQGFSKKEKNDDGIFRFLFVGAVNYRKGVNFLLKAWQKADLKNAELLICGRIYRKMRKFAKSRNFSKVRFLGFVDPKDYFKKADIFVFPSLLEGSAKAIYEAMSFGLPIITTFNSGSIVENEKQGFIVPIGDADAIREKMIYFLEHSEKIEEMADSALEKIKKYSWENYAKSILENYENYLK